MSHISVIEYNFVVINIYKDLKRNISSNLIRKEDWAAAAGAKSHDVM